MSDWWLDDETDFPEKAEEFTAIVQAFAGVAKRGWNRASCPRCREMDGGEDKKKSLGFNTRTRGYNCFRCGMHGSLPQSWMSRLGDVPDDADADAVDEQSSEPPEEALGYQPIFSGGGLGCRLFDRAREYLTQPKSVRMGDKPCRGLAEGALRAAGVGASICGKFVGRVIIPIPDLSGILTDPWRGWVSRSIPPSRTPPYLYAKHMDRIGLLYNASCLLVPTQRPVFVVEGTLDAIALWPDAVAVLGKPLESQVELLLEAERPIAVCLDGDAWQEGWALAMKLRHLGAQAVNVRLPPKVDPDEVPRDELEALVDDALIEGDVQIYVA